MKKILILMLASALILSSCGGNDTNETDISTSESDTTISDTLGDENGDGVIEDNNEGESEIETDDIIDDDDSVTEDELPSDAVTSVTSAEDAVTFINVNVYSQCADNLPMGMDTNILPLDDMDLITHHTGLTDLEGITDIILSESMVGSIPYSLVMVRTDGTNTDDIQTALAEKINPRKWVCVSADQMRTIRLDNDVILVMSNTFNENVIPVMNAIVAAADGVYSEIGSVVNVLG